MRCQKCHSEKFELQERRLKIRVRNSEIELGAEAQACKGCGATNIDHKQMNRLRRLATDKYREQHNLLTSKDITEFRAQFGMSQKAFSLFLGIGEASLKRWETYYIQDGSQDEHIRIKCDPLYAKLNLEVVLEKYSNLDLFNGLKNFSFDLAEQATLYFVKNTQANTELLSRLQFYADFFNFKQHQKSITGTSYLPLKQGPHPERFHLVCKMLEREKKIKILSDHTCVTELDPDMSKFNDEERKSLDYVCNLCSKMGSHLIGLSQKEKAFLDTNNHSYISYGHAQSLLI